MMRMREGLGTGLGFRVGEGKTRPTIERIARMHKEGKANLVCVVNTVSGLYVWVENWGDWADIPALFIDLRVHGSDGLRTAKAMAAKGNLVICIISYGAALTLGFKRVKKDKKVPGQDVTQQVTVLESCDLGLADLDWDIMVLDEAHKIKSQSSKVSQFFRTKIRPKCKERFALTGSLITKRPGDAWAVVKFLTGDEIFPGAFHGSKENYATSFAGRYGVPHPYIRGAIIAWTNLDDFARRLAKCFYVPAEDALKLPPRIDLYRYVDLNPKSKKLYAELTKNLFAELEGWEAEGRKEYSALISHLELTWPARVTKERATWGDEHIFRTDIERDARRFIAAKWAGGALAIPKAEFIEDLRAHALSVKTVTVDHVFSVMRKQSQITAGYIKPDPPEDDPGKEMELVPLGTEKIDEALDQLEKLWPEPTILVVTGNYEEENLIKAISTDPRFKTDDGKQFKPKVLNGSVQGAKTRHDLIAAAANDPCFVLKLQAGCESIDCRWARTFIFVSKTANTIQYQQVLARNRRGGQTQTCKYIHIVVKGTVDERIEEILNTDLNVAKHVEKDWRSMLLADGLK